MSTRRTRSSLGGPEPPEVDQLQHFDDFRRRHSRQNREIITENISRKNIIGNLQNQIAELQGELLEVRHINRMLQRRMQKMHDDHKRQRGEFALDALDSLLEAVPALRQLRETLASKAPPILGGTSRHGGGSTSRNRPMVNPTATYPAASAAEMHELGMLCEASEPEESPYARGRKNRTPKKFSAASGSVESPQPKLLFNQSSPVNSPSPKRTSTPRKHRRRRESGLLIPPAITPDPSPSPSMGLSPAASPARTRTPVQSETDTADTWDEGEEIRLSPAEATELLEEVAVEFAVTPKKSKTSNKKASSTSTASKSPSATPRSSLVKNIAANYEAQLAAATSAPTPTRSPGGSTLTPRRVSPVIKGKAPRTVLVLEHDDKEETAAPAPAAAPAANKTKVRVTQQLPSPSPEPEALERLLPASAIDETVEVEGTRARRSARGSAVNYKEPSLRKKMRKPDGVPVDEALGVRRKSALPRSAAKLILSVAGGDEGAEETEGAETEASDLSRPTSPSPLSAARELAPGSAGAATRPRSTSPLVPKDAVEGKTPTPRTSVEGDVKPDARALAAATTAGSVTSRHRTAARDVLADLTTHHDRATSAAANASASAGAGGSLGRRFGGAVRAEAGAKDKEIGVRGDKAATLPARSRPRAVV